MVCIWSHGSNVGGITQKNKLLVPLLEIQAAWVAEIVCCDLRDWLQTKNIRAIVVKNLIRLLSIYDSESKQLQIFTCLQTFFTNIEIQYLASNFKVLNNTRMSVTIGKRIVSLSLSFYNYFWVFNTVSFVLFCCLYIFYTSEGTIFFRKPKL